MQGHCQLEVVWTSAYHISLIRHTRPGESRRRPVKIALGLLKLTVPRRRRANPGDQYPVIRVDDTAFRRFGNHTSTEEMRPS